VFQDVNRGAKWDGGGACRGNKPVRLAVVLNHVTGVDRALLFPAQDVLETHVSWDRPERHFRLGRRDSEALVVLLDETREGSFGFRQRLGTHEAQVNHQPLLEGCPQALNAALGLWGSGLDVLASKLNNHLADLAEWHLPLQLLFEGELRTLWREEERVTVGIERQRDAMGEDDLRQKISVTRETLSGAKGKGHDAAGGIIDSTMEPSRARGLRASRACWRRSESACRTETFAADGDGAWAAGAYGD